ncbi:MAG: hypothetical protein LUB59_00525 [Candidatus Gastranaerophilales bacterium]|nr:hypothetical protein [Candidatus Gastranaerophilales bacterium]
MNITRSTNMFLNSRSALETKSQALNNNRNMYDNYAANPVFSGKERIPARIIDECIDEVVNANPANIAAKMKFHKVINKASHEIMSPENYMSSGRESKVYRISDRYVLKARRGKTAGNAVHFWNVTTAPDKKFNKLSCYYGEPLVKLGNIEILKNAAPNTDSIQCGIPFVAGNNYVHMAEECKKYKKNYIPRAASLPQSSYDEFANDLKILNGMKGGIPGKRVYYAPDVINPNNVLIVDDRIRIVDKLETTSIPNPNSLYTMLDPLLIRFMPEKYAEADASITGDRIQIFKKCLIAGEKSNLPLDLLLPPYMEDYKINSKWALSQILPATASDAISNLKKMRKIYSPIRSRIEYINSLPDK